MTDLDSIPDPIKIAVSRRMKLEHCLKWRSFIAGKTKPAPGFSREWCADRLREEQIGLLKLRVWRTTGQYPTRN
jgi:hypothetical protein